RAILLSAFRHYADRAPAHPHGNADRDRGLATSMRTEEEHLCLRPAVLPILRDREVGGGAALRPLEPAASSSLRSPH
ncbi:unnamed protein product, partial [Urochloa humidicola]